MCSQKFIEKNIYSQRQKCPNMFYSFIYARLHFMFFIWFQSLFKVSVWDSIHSPSDCWWSRDNAWNVWRWDKTFISIRWSAENFPKSFWVKKFNLQSSIFMYIHFSHYFQPTKMYHRYHWHTKNTWCFLYLFSWSMVCWNQIEETLYHHLCVCEQFCCKMLV